MTKYWTATYIGLTPMTFLWGVTDYLFSMHTVHLANVSKSVTKNATFPRTGGLPCLITQQLHVCCISYSFGGLIFCISATPHLGYSFPLFHAQISNTHDHHATSDQPRHRGQQRTQPHLLLINDLGINHLRPASSSSKPSHVLRPRAPARQTKQMLLLADFQWEIGPEWIKYSLENIQKMEVTLRRFPFHSFSFNTQAWKVFA